MRPGIRAHTNTMKVLQINCVYGEGSTGEITRLIHEELLRAGHDSRVIYGRGRTMRGEGIMRLCPEAYGKMQGLRSRLTGVMYGGCFLSTARLLGYIRREKPDVVHLQCVNGYFVNIFRLVEWLKKHRIKTVVTLHAEFLYTGNCGHAFACEQWRHGCVRCPRRRGATKSWFLDRTGYSWRRMAKAFCGFERDCVVTAVSPWTAERAKGGDILREFPVETILNGVDTEVFRPRDGNGQKEERPWVFHASAHFSMEKEHPKGGWYFAELARRMPQVRFAVAGRYDVSEGLPPNLRLLGRMDDPEELARWYSAADLTVLLSRRETFSMPCAESLCCGTPVAGFRAGGPESIALRDYSEFVEHGDLDALVHCVKAWLRRESTDRERIAALGREMYSRERMTAAYLDLYRRLV